MPRTRRSRMPRARAVPTELRDDWRYVYVPTGRIWGRPRVRVRMREGAVEVPVTTWTPDVEAQAELVALFDRWRSEGRGEIIERLGVDGEETPETIVATIGRSVVEAVSYSADECKFF